MKKVYLIIVFSSLFFVISCKPTMYVGNYGQVNQTQVVLSNANFRVLGSFTGSAVVKKTTFSIHNNKGLIAKAKQDLLENARKAGVELTGSRALVNVTTDVVQNEKKLKAIVSAEIIEFYK